MQETEKQTIEDRTTFDSPSADPAAEGPSTLRIPVHAEELLVGTRRVSRGAVRLHVGVATEERTVQVPLFHEEMVIEHLAPDAFEAALAEDPDARYVPIYAEELVVEKRTVLKEYIRVRTRRVEELRTVSEPVRREYVEAREMPRDRVDDR
jgi:uncharacterized protein (TIGR02271 family)